MAEKLILAHTPYRQQHYLWVRDDTHDDEIVIRAVRHDASTPMGMHVCVPKSAVPDLIAALQYMLAGPLGRAAIDAEKQGEP